MWWRPAWGDSANEEGETGPECQRCLSRNGSRLLIAQVLFHSAEPALIAVLQDDGYGVTLTKPAARKLASAPQTTELQLAAWCNTVAILNVLG